MVKKLKKLVNEVLANCPGFEGTYATNPTPTIVMAKFNTAGMAMTMIKNQKFNPKMKENKLWASENRSPTERRQCKLVSKLKKFLIEHDKQDPKKCHCELQMVQCSRPQWEDICACGNRQ